MDGEKMCPLLTMGNLACGMGPVGPVKCERETCAWWIADGPDGIPRCSIRSIAEMAFPDRKEVE